MDNSIEIKRSSSRFHTDIDWLDSWHSFSFGSHYDPNNTGHGQLVVNNDDVVRAGTGFGTHAHADMEIVTWILDGELEHRDSLGTVGIIKPGEAQRMSAGTGVRHSEANPSSTNDVHLIQMWVLPDAKGIEPSYEQKSLGEFLTRNELVPIASGKDHPGAVAIHQRDAVLWVGRLDPGGSVDIPDAPFVHIYIARGSAQIGAEAQLKVGDAARLTQAGVHKLVANDENTEILIWETA